jgi:hypothetical protein
MNASTFSLLCDYNTDGVFRFGSDDGCIIFAFTKKA